jgi:hypothetical protein
MATQRARPPSVTAIETAQHEQQLPGENNSGHNLAEDEPKSQTLKKTQVRLTVALLIY